MLTEFQDANNGQAIYCAPHTVCYIAETDMGRSIVGLKQGAVLACWWR